MKEQNPLYFHALKKLQHYCAYQDRCHYEVEMKLKELDVTEDVAGEVILSLIQDGFLNEERFTRSYARGKFKNQQWGKIKIISGLMAKRISEPLIKEALTEIDEEEYSKVLEDLLMKIYHQKNDLYKAISSLAAKGFETELIYKAAEQLGLKS